MEHLRLDLAGIHEYQRNRAPYLLMDIAEEVIPGVSAIGYKDLHPDEWFFKVHWPGNPNMPGMLQVEALIQMCALAVLTLPGNKGKVVYVTSLSNARFSKKVLPGDRLQIQTKLHSWKRGVGSCSGQGLVSGEIACQAGFNLVLPDELNQFKVISKGTV